MLEQDIKDLVAAGASADREKRAPSSRRLNRSRPARCAPPNPGARSSPLGWRVNLWVKQGILLGFSSATWSTCRWIRAAVLRQGHAAAGRKLAAGVP
jgi:hypothetical protein